MLQKNKKNQQELGWEISYKKSVQENIKFESEVFGLFKNREKIPLVEFENLLENCLAKYKDTRLWSGDTLRENLCYFHREFGIKENYENVSPNVFMMYYSINYNHPLYQTRAYGCKKAA